LPALVFLPVFTVLALFFNVFLFCWSEETTWYLFEKLVGNLLCAVAKSLEGEGCHLSTGQGIRMSECDVVLTWARHCDWSAIDWAQQKDGGAWLGGWRAERLNAIGLIVGDVLRSESNTGVCVEMERWVGEGRCLLTVQFERWEK
jgi:hypothetical protein